MPTIRRLLLVALAAAMFTPPACGDDGGRSGTDADADKRNSPAPPTRPESTALPQASTVAFPAARPATTSPDAGAAGSAETSSSFESLWSSAQEKSPPLNAPMAVFLKKATFCKRYKCGDQFEPDAKYAPLVEKGKETIASTWRFEIRQRRGMFSLEERDVVVGDYSLKSKAIPFSVRWPVEVDHVTYSPRKPKYEGTGLWKRTLENIYEYQFSDGSSAREWHSSHKEIFVRYIFNIVGGVINPHEYGTDVLIIKILGRQIRTKRGEIIDEVVME